ncbi:MAG: hypothetical protein K1X57_00790 [Gemmataceae bacterium]|nr:hypothetical protein [Gemmataceae bacterium]
MTEVSNERHIMAKKTTTTKATEADAIDFRKRIQKTIDSLKALNKSQAEVAKKHPEFGKLATYSIDGLTKLLNGKEFVNFGLIADCPRLVKHFAKHRAKAKECFCNCQGAVALVGRDATYYEGVVATDLTQGKVDTLAHHGWIVVDGMVYDPTLERAAKQFGIKLGPRRYFGVALSFKMVTANVVENNARPFLDLSFLT